jgi:methionyl-tRNA synthetase
MATNVNNAVRLWTLPIWSIKIDHRETLLWNRRNWFCLWIVMKILKEWILVGHKNWKPNVYGQVKSWIDGGLEPRAVTRDLDWNWCSGWGAEGKNYMSGLTQLATFLLQRMGLAKKIGNPTGKDTKLVHFIEDNIVFHCIIFQRCWKQKEVIFCQTTFLRMSSWT